MTVELVSNPKENRDAGKKVNFKPSGTCKPEEKRQHKANFSVLCLGESLIAKPRLHYGSLDLKSTMLITTTLHN